jgi:hypothetical protein
LFAARLDVYPQRWENKTGKSGYSPVCANEWVDPICKKPKIKCTDCSHKFFSNAFTEHSNGLGLVTGYPLKIFWEDKIDNIRIHNNSSLYLTKNKREDFSDPKCWPTRPVLIFSTTKPYREAAEINHWKYLRPEITFLSNSHFPPTCMEKLHVASRCRALFTRLQHSGASSC